MPVYATLQVRPYAAPLSLEHTDWSPVSSHDSAGSAGHEGAGSSGGGVVNVGVAYGPGVNCVEVVVETVLGCEDAMEEPGRTVLERVEADEATGGVLLGMLALLSASVASEGMLALLELRIA